MADRITLFRNALKYLQEKNKMTQGDLANAVGCSRRTIQGILSDKEKKKPSLKYEQNILQYFGTSYQDMLDLGRAVLDGINKEMSLLEAGDLEADKNTEKYRLIKVPVISWNFLENLDRVMEGIQLGDAEDWVGLYRSESDLVFALRIKGDAMSPEFNPGEIIIVDPELEPETGDFAVIRVIGDNGNDEILFKQFMIDGNRIYLKSMNENYPFIEITGKEYQVIGCVIQKQHIKNYLP